MSGQSNVPISFPLTRCNHFFCGFPKPGIYIASRPINHTHNPTTYFAALSPLPLALLFPAGFYFARVHLDHPMSKQSLLAKSRITQSRQMDINFQVKEWGEQLFGKWHLQRVVCLGGGWDID